MNIKPLFLSLGFALALQSCGSIVTKEHLAQLDRIVADTETEVAEAERDWTRAMTEELPQIQTEESVDECGVEFSRRSRDLAIAFPRWIAQKQLVSSNQIPPPFSSKQILIVYNAEQLSNQPNPYHQYLLQELRQMRKQEENYSELSGEALIEAAQQLTNPDEFTGVLVIAIDSEIAAEKVGKEFFQSGVLLGKSYLYSHQKKQIICAGNLLATSSDTVSIMSFGDSATTQVDAQLEFDLFFNLLDSAIDSLKAINL